jgi:hypothetical protein
MPFRCPACNKFCGVEVEAEVVGEPEVNSSNDLEFDVEFTLTSTCCSDVVAIAEATYSEMLDHDCSNAELEYQVSVDVTDTYDNGKKKVFGAMLSIDIQCLKCHTEVEAPCEHLDIDKADFE